MKTPLGQKIRAVRIVRGMTQEELSERSGVSQGYLSKIESDSQVPKKLSTLSAIIRAVATGEQQAELLAEATKIVLSN